MPDTAPETSPPAGRHLTELARIPTSGARAVASFVLGGQRHLVIPQLAVDVPGAEPDMNGGDSDAAGVLVLRRAPGTAQGFEEVARLDAPGGEDAEAFRIGERTFLAVATIRSGSGPYDYARTQHVHEWDGEAFVPFWSVEGYAAKQWRHLEVDGRHFLALAQGVALPGHEQANLPSRLYEWTGEGFEHFQDVESAWGYNWHALTVDGHSFLAYADHVRPSVLLRWDGERFVEHQVLTPSAGRAFADLTHDGQTYLVVAQIFGASRVLRFDGERFVEHQVLEGTAAREVAVLTAGDETYVVRVNFIEGTPHDPVPALSSQLYRWQGGALEVVEEFPTLGGTDVTAWQEGDETLVAVSNSLSAEVRFASDTVLYRFTPTPSDSGSQA